MLLLVYSSLFTWKIWSISVHTQHQPSSQTIQIETSRERPKSAPYLRLKNSKRTSKYSLLRYRKNPKVEPNWHTRGDTLKFFIHSVANQKKLKEGHFWWKKILKSLTMPKNLKGGTLWDFSTSVLSENSKKLKGGPFGKKIFEKKSHRAENTLSPFGPFEFLRWCKKAFKVFYLNLLSKNCKILRL